MLSTSLELTVIPCGKKEPFRGEPASCSALNMGMLTLPNIRGQGEVPTLPTLMDNLSCSSPTLLQTVLTSSYTKVSFHQCYQTKWCRHSPISNIWSSVKMARAALLDTLWPPTPHTVNPSRGGTRAFTKHNSTPSNTDLFHLIQWMLDASPKPFILKATWTFSLKAQIILINIFPSSSHNRKRYQYKSTALCIWLY